MPDFETTYPDTVVSPITVYPAPPAQWMISSQSFDAWESSIYVPGTTQLTPSESSTVQQMNNGGFLVFDPNLTSAEVNSAPFIYAYKAIETYEADTRNLANYWTAQDPNTPIFPGGPTGPALQTNMDEVTVHVVDYTNNGHGAWTNPPTTTPDGSVATHWDIYIDPWSQDAADYAQHFGGNWQMALNYMVQHEFGHANQINYQFWTAYNGDANALQAQEVLADAYADGLNTNFPTDSGFTTFTGYHPGMIIMGGTSGPDVLEGTTQTAFITGGGGIDTVDYSTATAGIVADLTPRTSWPTPMNIYFGITNLSGSPYNDTLIGDANNNTITGGAGDDSIAGGDGNDYLQGNQGFDTINGNAGNDTIHGGADGDLVRGGQGNDYIIGDNSNDQIYGDVGNDTMTGGGGADAFYTQHGFGSDVITDFNQAEGDKIHVLGGASWTTFQSGANTVVQLDDGTVLTLQNVQSSTLTPGWIVAG